MLTLTFSIVSRWMSVLGRRVEMTTWELGKVLDAFSITPLTDVATLSCCALRLLVPVCMMMWLGHPSCSSGPGLSL